MSCKIQPLLAQIDEATLLRMKIDAFNKQFDEVNGLRNILLEELLEVGMSGGYTGALCEQLSDLASKLNTIESEIKQLEYKLYMETVPVSC